jgi:hypothetical protein
MPPSRDIFKYFGFKPRISMLELSEMLSRKGITGVYPNIAVVLRMALAMPATNCSGERSFSAMKRVKDYTRAAVGQERFNALSLLAIEHTLVEQVETGAIIERFAATKARRHVF